MAWRSNDFDPPMVSKAILTAMEEALSKAAHIPQSQEPAVEAVDIAEYDGRMRVAGLERLQSTCYVSVVHFFLNQADLERRKPKGALVFYLECENAGKFFKTLGLEFADDEDDMSMIAACGQFALQVAESINKELGKQGCVTLLLSRPRNYKNSVLEGVEFSTDQKTKHQITYYYFKHKVIGIDFTLAPIPKK